MANSISTSIQEMITPNMKQALAARMGESPQTVKTGLNTGISAILSAIASQAGDNNFVNQLMNFVRGATEQNISASVPSLVSQGLNGGAGELVNRFLSMIFGADQAKAAAVVVQKAGVSEVTASSLLSMAAPLVLGYFSKSFSAGTLNAATFANTLRSEAGNLQPADYMTQTQKTSAAGAVTNLRTTELGDGPGPGRTALSFVLLGSLGAIIMTWMAYRSLNTWNLQAQPVTSAAAEAAVRSANAVSDTVNSATAAAGVAFKKKLRDGTELSIPKMGVESNLVDFLDSSKPVDKTAWFDFDRIQFGTNDATLQPSSMEQLQNVAAILKAYPKAKVRIGGYTDSTGDTAANLKLSDERAKTVADQLEKMGVDKSRISAKGYGDQHAIAPNDTEEGRQKNRRISLLVTEK
jgi:outer membrane protein OmpA-like peptidoglycan-associated protein